jgi:hypothetical protein
MAVLRFVATSVSDHEAVATLDACNLSAPNLTHGDVRSIVAIAQDCTSRCCSNDAKLSCFRYEGGEADISAIVPIIGAATACVVMGLRARITINVVLQKAGSSRFTGEWKLQLERFRDCRCTKHHSPCK